ncbi:MAG: hypothetical protein KF779_16625 [Hyphomonadaceae bacterium]|nr:hypothetical protein [Hyphomonadaceae bacterium]
MSVAIAFIVNNDYMADVEWSSAANLKRKGLLANERPALVPRFQTARFDLMGV